MCDSDSELNDIGDRVALHKTNRSSVFIIGKVKAPKLTHQMKYNVNKTTGSVIGLRLQLTDWMHASYV